MMNAVLTRFFGGVSLFCFGLAIVGCVYALFAAACALRFAQRCDTARRDAAKGSAGEPAVSLLKPLHGAEPGLAEALSTFCQQTYSGMVNIVFGVGSPADAAVPIAHALIEQHPGCAAEIVIDGARHGSNGKVSNLTNMSRAIRHDIVILADSDIVVPSEYLRVVTRALAQPQIGAVTCLYSGVAANQTQWSRLSAAAIDWHFLPSVLVGTALGLAKPCMGSTIALRRQTLGAIGGFSVLANQLADDYVLGERVREQQLRTTLAPVIVGHLCQDATFTQLWRHEIRWACTIRLVDPAGFYGSVITHPVPLAFLGSLFAGFAPWSLLGLGCAFGVRAILATGVGRLLSGRRLDFPLLLARDMLSFVVFVASAFTLRVRWRGAKFSVAGDGTMQPRE